MKIDAHQHFWVYSPEEYDWIGEQETVLKRNFLPSDLKAILLENNLNGCVAVQARQTNEETQWLIELANTNDIIKGVVGWIDLRSDTLDIDLQQYESSTVLKGFRHVLQGEKAAFMLEPEFIRGLKVLEQKNYTYDLLVYAHQLPQTIELAKQFSSLRLVIDHIAKPAIKANEGFEEWKAAMVQLARQPNIYCKVSGMVTEADIHNWNPEQFTPYLDVIFTEFGSKRVMFGSDWPVCLLAERYKQVKDIVEDYVKQKYSAYYDDVFGKNAETFYQLA